MTTQNLALFKGLGAKMNFLNQRQRIIAQNISNADTPNYRPKDLVPVDFTKVLSGIIDGNKVRMDSTNPGHMPKLGAVPDAKSRKQKETYEVAPDGNAVIMEEQLIMSGRTVADYNLMANLYQKHVRMLQTALGR